MRPFKYIISLLLIFTTYDALCQGISFDRMGYINGGITSSYNVFEKIHPSCSDQLRISFELSIYDQSSMGYVLRVKDRKSKNPDLFSLVFSQVRGGECCLKVNKESESHLAVDTVDNYRLGDYHWMAVTLEFLPAKDSLVLSVDGRTYRVGEVGLPKRITPEILFGTSLFSEELPAFAIRDLSVVCDTRKFEFPLDESSGEIVHDSHGKPTGRTLNPIWLVKNSYSWNKMWNTNSETMSGVCYGYDNDKFVIFTTDSIKSFNVRNQTAMSSATKNRLGVDFFLGANFIDPASNRLYSYEICTYQPNSPTVEYLNFDSMQWRSLSRQTIDGPIHHHSSIYDPSCSKFYVFGGFGSRSYFSRLTELDAATGQLRNIALHGDVIDPRFFSSMCMWKPGHILLYGGTGNSTGDQALGKVYYYDLYDIDLRSGEVIKLWSADSLYREAKLSPVRSMIVSDDSSSLYTLCYPVHLADSHLQLYRISLADGTMEPQGDTISMESKSILSNANIYYDRTNKVFYCYTQEFDPKGGQSARINIYSLVTPLVSKELLSKYDHTTTPLSSIIGAVVAAVLLIAGVLFYVRRRSNRGRLQAPQTENHPPPRIPLQPNSIHLFGIFTVIDRNGRDITYMFSTKLRQLFVYMLINSLEKQEGVNSALLQSVIWPDKSPKSAKNLKGVAISHLRKVLADVEGVSVIYNDNNYSIDLSADVWCDYRTFIEAYSSLESDTSRLKELVSILGRGKLLQSLHDDIFDHYKSEYEQKCVSFINNESAKEYERHNYSVVISYAKILFAIDPTNTHALWYMVNSLRALRRDDASKKIYYLFVEEYRRSFAAEFNISFNQLTNTSIERLIGR